MKNRIQPQKLYVCVVIYLSFFVIQDAGATCFLNVYNSTAPITLNDQSPPLACWQFTNTVHNNNTNGIAINLNSGGAAYIEVTQSADIFGKSKAIYNRLNSIIGDPSTLGYGFLNNGTITSDDWGIYNEGTITTLTNNGTIHTSLVGRNSLSAAIYNAGTIGDIVNTSSIRGDWMYGIVNYTSASINSITNASGGTIYGSYAAIENYDYNSTIASISNSGTITSDGGNSGQAILSYGSITTLNNLSGGVISGTNGASGVVNALSIGSLVNDGTISSAGAGGSAIYNYSYWTINDLPNPVPTITTLTNNGTITSDDWGIYNEGTITTLTNNGTISSTLVGRNNLSAAIYNAGTIGDITNTNLIHGDWMYGIVNYTNASINSITNTSNGASNGIIYGSYAAIENYDYNSTIGSINNSGIIFSDGGGSGQAILSYGTITSLHNLIGGLISGINGASGIVNALSIDSLVNDGTISSTGSGGSAIYNYSYWTLNDVPNPVPTITTLINNGTITSDDWGIYNEGTITTLTNNGTISAVRMDVDNTLGNILTLNNSQGGNGSNPSTTALTYKGNLPTDYNIIINSPTHYGQLAVTTPSGSTNFSIYAGGVTGVSASVVSKGTYGAVLSGLTTSNIGATRTGTYSGLNWTLALQNGSSTVWDLIFSGTTLADAQLSLHSLAPKLRGAFSGQVLATNFANMNTYDCDLFDSRGLCVSVGGQQTYVDNPSANQTSTVLTLGYKVSPTIRIGGFLNQNVNNHTSANVDISNANPLMGLFAVWNQNEDHLGYQVKIANAYQDKDVTTTRDIIGTSEAGTGSTNLNTQSYVGELSYAFLANEDKTLVRPYAAVRYTRIKQDGYTEQTTSTVTAPLTYASLEDRSTNALLGVKLDHKLADNFHLKGSVGIEQDLYHHVDNLTATGVSGLTSENFNDNIKRTRPVASIGAYFIPAKNQRIAGDIYYQQLPFQSTASTTAYVNYMIGF